MSNKNEELETLLARGVALARDRRVLRAEELEGVQGGVMSNPNSLPEPPGKLEGFVPNRPILEKTFVA